MLLLIAAVAWRRAPCIPPRGQCRRRCRFKCVSYPAMLTCLANLPPAAPTIARMPVLISSALPIVAMSRARPRRPSLPQNPRPGCRPARVKGLGRFRRLDHRQDARLDCFGQGRPSVNQGLQVGLNCSRFVSTAPASAPASAEMPVFPMFSGVSSPVCKTAIRGFDSHRRLFLSRRFCFSPRSAGSFPSSRSVPRRYGVRLGHVLG